MKREDKIGYGLLIGAIALSGVITAFQTRKQVRQNAEFVAAADSSPSIGPANMPDGGVIAWTAEQAGVPAAVALAVAWQETRGNTSPNVRGLAGEWGRFQILPQTARARCPTKNIETVAGNRSCFLKMMNENYRQCGGWDCAIRIHNGSGDRALKYADSVLATAHDLIQRELGR